MDLGELEESQIQNLAEILSEELTNADVEDAVHLADAAKWDKRNRAGKEPRLIGLLRNANYSDDLQDVLRSLIIRADINDNHALAHDLNDILTGTSLILAHTNEGYQLVSKTNEHAEETKEEHQTFLETKAPGDVVSRLNQARVLLANGDYDNALQECRRALENMTEDGNYGWALEELHDNGLIEKDTDPGDQKPVDREIAKDAYNYLSNTGSHAGANSPKANKRQGELGYIFTVEVIVFLLRAIEEGKQNGVTFNRWAV